MEMASSPIAVITRTERRRRWSLEDKLRLAAETRRPGMSVARVAQQHGVAQSLLFAWRKQVACGALSEPTAGHEGFVPVRIMPEAAVAASPGGSPTTLNPADAPDAGLAPDGAAALGAIEIALPNGCRLRVSERVGAVALKRVVTVLAGVRT